jgi:hypothetical protein
MASTHEPALGIGSQWPGRTLDNLTYDMFQQHDPPVTKPGRALQLGLEGVPEPKLRGHRIAELPSEHFESLIGQAGG